MLAELAAIMTGDGDSGDPPPNPDAASDIDCNPLIKRVLELRQSVSRERRNHDLLIAALVTGGQAVKTLAEAQSVGKVIDGLELDLWQAEIKARHAGWKV